MNNKHYCPICDQEINRSYIEKHNKSKKHQNNKKKTTEFALNYLFYECRVCKQRMKANRFIQLLYDDYDDILEITEENKYSAWEIRSPTSYMGGGKGGDVIEYEIPKLICNCSKKHKINIYVEFTFTVPNTSSSAQVFYINEIDNLIPLDSTTMELISDIILLEGQTILNLLHWLFERWAAMNYSIEIVSPFVDNKACWDKLYEISVTFNNRIHSTYPISIFTRSSQNFNPPISLETQLTKWFDEMINNSDCDRNENQYSICYSNLNYPCIHNLGKEMVSNVFYTRKRFHAKYYTGSALSGEKEIVFTSFNLIKSELNQLETFYLHQNTRGFTSIKDKMSWLRIDYLKILNALKPK